MSLTREEIADQYIDDQLKPHHRKRLVSGLVSAIKHRERLAMEKMFDKLAVELDSSGTLPYKQEFIDSIIS